MPAFHMVVPKMTSFTVTKKGLVGLDHV